MVLLICIGSRFIVVDYYTFTFQYGSTYIFFLKTISHILSVFTFQYGSTYIKADMSGDNGDNNIYIPIWFYLYL